MLFNNQGKQVQLKPDASDHAKRQVTEKLWPQSHKGHIYFRLDQRARFS